MQTRHCNVVGRPWAELEVKGRTGFEVQVFEKILSYNCVSEEDRQCPSSRGQVCAMLSAGINLTGGVSQDPPSQPRGHET